SASDALYRAASCGLAAACANQPLTRLSARMRSTRPLETAVIAGIRPRRSYNGLVGRDCAAAGKVEKTTGAHNGTSPERHTVLPAPALITVGEVAHAFELSPTHLTKVAQTLAEHGLVQTVRGRSGGVRLLGDPETISLGRVVRMTEPDFQMAPCMEPGRGVCA